jgi:hypothetical protein
VCGATPCRSVGCAIGPNVMANITTPMALVNSAVVEVKIKYLALLNVSKYVADYDVF